MPSLLVAMPGAPSSFLLLVAMPGGLRFADWISGIFGAAGHLHVQLGRCLGQLCLGEHSD